MALDVETDRAEADADLAFMLEQRAQAYDAYDRVVRASFGPLLASVVTLGACTWLAASWPWAVRAIWMFVAFAIVSSVARIPRDVQGMRIIRASIFDVWGRRYLAGAVVVRVLCPVIALGVLWWSAQSVWG
jgi:hypothetical protein